MHLKFIAKLPFILGFLVAAVFEWAEYSLTPFMNWPKFTHGASDTIKILIVADPQLLGYRFSAPSLLGLIYRWDADRYIMKTFSLAYHHIKPDLTIFLGDNFDEGEIASELEFSQYFERFKYVFRAANFKKAIIIPGDNDIGGESQPPQREMEHRFNEHFKDDIQINYKFLDLIKINYISFSNQYQNEVQNFSKDAFKIILSHLPLTTSYSSFVSKVIEFVQPHVIISAHDHKSQLVVTDLKTGAFMKMQSSFELNSSSFNVSNSVVREIIAPTCSYRMGTHKMGYGALEISKSGEVTYNVLWLPSRFRQLYIHLFVLCCLLIYFFCFVLKTYTRRQTFFPKRSFHLIY